MERNTEDKAERILSIYSRLKQGQVIDKDKESEKYRVTSRTIQRDIADIQRFLKKGEKENGIREEVVYDKQSGGYRLELKFRVSSEERELLEVYKRIMQYQSDK